MYFDYVTCLAFLYPTNLRQSQCIPCIIFCVTHIELLTAYKRTGIHGQILRCHSLSLLRGYLGTWSQVARYKTRRHRTKTLLAIIVKKQERAVVKAVFTELETQTLVSPLVLHVVSRRVRYREIARVGEHFTAWAAMLRASLRLRDAGEVLRVRSYLQAVRVCLILWMRCTSESFARVATHEGHLQDFPYDCKVLLMSQDFPVELLKRYFPVKLTI